MRMLFAGLILIVAGTARADDPKVSWHTHKDEKGNMSVEFPGEPKKIERSNTVQALLEAEDGKAVYIAAYTPLPMPVDLDGELPKQMLRDSQSSMEKSLNGKVLSSKEVKHADKYPARDIQVEAPGIGIYKTRVIVTENRLFQVTVLGPKDFVESANVKRFFGSFKITN